MSVNEDLPVMHRDVSACLIVKDAAATLARGLESIRDLMHEIIVVDTGSSDGTPALAEALGARVFHFAWIDDFAAARNEALRHASGPWILSLDADEYFDDDNHRKLRDLLVNLPEHNAAYVFTMRSPMPGGSPLDIQNIRFFRRHPEIRWQYRVHEQLGPAIRRLGYPIHVTDIVIHHAGYEDAQTRRRKIERNARLLELDLRDHRDDAFVLFNLGTAYDELGRADQAIALLRRSLQLSPPEYSTIRDTYAALVQCHRRLGQRDAAWAVCREGRQRFPDDVALWFAESQLRRDAGDLRGAEQCLLGLIRSEPGAYFGATDAGIRSYVAPHTLGLIYLEQGRTPEAEHQWRAVVTQYPFYHASWQMLAELYLRQQRWTELETIIDRFEATAAWAAEGAILRARWHLAKREFAAARGILERLIAQSPTALPPRFYLTHVLLGEGRDWAAAERALRELLRVDPTQAQGWYNLAALLRRQNRLGEARETCAAGLRHCPGDRDLAALHQSMRGQT
jgi:tetratricopeptide (TPR) repeat protein